MTVSDTRSTSKTDRVELLRQMLRIRRFEEKCAELYSGSKIRGFLHLYIGEEAIAAGIMQHLSPVDAIVATYREHGHALARGIPMDRLMAEMYGKATGVSGGRGGSMHIFDADTNFYGGNAIVGGGLPLAVGIALADKLRGEPAVTACFFGEGAVAEGEFHESANLASLWKLPIVFFCENNLYAMGTALERSEAQTDLVTKARSYSIEAEAVDGMDVSAISGAAACAIEHARSGRGPYFLELQTYRFRAHSMYDPELYRDRREVEEWRSEHDPLDSLISTMRADDELSDDRLQQIEEQIAAEIDRAVQFAEESAWEPVETLERHVYAEGAAS
ncbi:MAG: pyruvate dehydrogenase (acetyl-transferring) E1 component subunit alpha [Thermomicrobiales bacterium]